MPHHGIQALGIALHGNALTKLLAREGLARDGVPIGHAPYGAADPQGIDCLLGVGVVLEVGHQQLAAIGRGEVVGVTAAGEGIQQAVEVSPQDQMLVGAVLLDLPAHGGLGGVAGPQNVQLVAQGAVEGHAEAVVQLAGILNGGIVVGHVTAHGGGGVAQGASVLDVGAGDGIGVVTAPDLGGVLHHAQIVAPAAAAAVLDHGVREQGMKPAEQLVDTAHMAEGSLLLTLGRQDIGIDGGEVAVHVPLEVVQRHVLEAGSEGIRQIVHHGGVAHVQHQLLAGLQRYPPGGGQGPLGMGAVEVAVGVDHLGLDPDAELDSLGLGPLHESLQTVGE